ncbi:cytoplasmic dynein 2 heavy chain 1 [Cydia pomonella]|uniref:cytoplasmic dynein 2 heavy chain 1 n=1 Tax=Cydia pomonella TaxID=82600 RepID=UPI002ADE7A80|nr:cytoplasmic dynein 2 heavy chain 1 [Cydia pomonella]
MMAEIKRFVTLTIEQSYNRHGLHLDSRSEEELDNFIHNPQILLLQGSITKGDSILLQTKVEGDKTKSVVFYKTAPEELTKEEAINTINIITLTNNAAASLYLILKQIYTPLLSTTNDLYSSKLHKNLTDLQSVLKILTYGKKDQDVIVIQSVEDEMDYWKTLAQKKDAHQKERESASSFCELFEDISEEIQSMPSLPMLEIREAVENVGGMLDDVWRITVKPYPQDRMTHILDVIGHMICKVIEKAFVNIHLWTVNGEPKDNEVLTLISESLHVAETWTGACRSLTETYWPNYALHAWTGKTYVPTFCLNFQDRLKQIHEIRSTYSQLIKLLTNDERADLKTDRMFEPFQGINVWICNGPTHAWDAAVSRFAMNLRPAEANISEKLRPRLHNTSTKQMLYEFMRYKSLIDRPLVKIALNSELEIFISSLISMLKSIQAQMDSDEVDVKMYQPPEMSPIVQQVQWAKQMEAKVKDIQICAEKYLKEFENSAELQQLSMQVLKDLKAMYTQLHEDWSRDLQAQVKNGKLQLSLDKPVVEFSAQSKMMVVNYNPRLVWAGLEARALAALGLPPPPAAALVDAAAAALHHARALQQVASFHNTLGERMIPSTRPLMLQAALDLSTLVQDQRAVYWNDEQQLRSYTDKLKSAVFQLESQNTYLTNQHIAIRGIVESLMDTELLAKQAEWKKKIKNIRDIIEAVEANGYKNTELWRSHWDWQLYKALECQYIKTLLSLHKHFPPVKVDLVLRGRTVRVQPPLEEIRVQHYHQLRRLVALPAQFVGLHTAGDSIFTAIADKHSWLGNKAVKQLEAAMSGVERAREAWTRRAALACVADLHALCGELLKEPADWEANFKACKAYGQAVAKMAFDDEKIDWIVVVTATLRHEFEAQARNLWSCLMSWLQASCRAAAAALHAFMARAERALEDRQVPKNAKELAEISANQQVLREKMPEMEKTVESLKKKGNMLRTWGGDASVDGTIKEWQKIQELMQSQQQMFEHQAEIVKASLSGEWENLNGGLESWASRWAQARARLGDARGASYRDMVARCRCVLEAHAHWGKLQADKDELLKECEKFNMAPTVSGSWEQAEKLITEDINLWAVMKEYNEDFESIAEQDWIVFHKKLHLLDDFTSKWSSKLEPYTTVTLYLKQELDKYSDLSTLLKYLRGTDFTERHWHEVYSILEMEYKKPDSLQVKDLLSAAANIKRHIKLLQKISTSASNESAIRSALNELEIWFAGARLAVTYYNDKAKRPVPIVKDFKEILTKIEEQQWVVSSVGADAGDASAAWDSRLRAARQLVRAASHAQRRWLYLEPILSNDEGELGIKFRKVDQGFRQATRIFEADPRLSVLLQSARLQSMLDSISEQLHACQSALKQYMDEKRSIFPRLYFLSDDDLLELLGQARAGAEGREAVMQTHLKKLFPGTSGVRLGPGNMSITALCSLYGETFQLDHPVDIDCPVEVWLKNLETEMRLSLKNMTIKCVVSSSLQEQDPFSLPTQILCLAQNIRFTEQAEKAIVSKDLHKLMANIEKESAYYAATEIEDESEKQKRQALLLQCAYYINVVRTLISNNVVATSDWLWQKHLRFYIQSSKEVIAKMGLAQISYSYEYLGINTGQFVRTELADECFLILTQSLHLGLMGNPFGPAGTGKTESVKALGGLVGRLVLVFNCDEAMDTECMGRLLSGLALCGAWGCFDEFNRLTTDTLANISHQLASLLAAMRENTGQATALLNGKHVTVSQWCGVAATMNPVGRGYGGRRALPAALERVLRPVAMVEPRGDQLARHLLAAQCVTDAETLAEDLYAVFSMASTLLGGQRHYDWGLRALKAAVGSAGAALAARPARPAAPRARRAALRRVLRLNNVSKLTAPDRGRFENILSLVFADVPQEEHATDPISSALDASVASLGLVHNKLQVQKCIELYEQMQQRMGVVVVGPPGCGKSTIRKLLKTALVQQGRNIVEYTMSPKAMSRSWLLGHIDPDTRQWSDGVISATALQVSNQSADVWCWVVMDGDVDPSWVEALNSVLDDNRLLTLPSGWRVQFGANVTFLFETHGLDHASPATLSRLGVILMSKESSGIEEVMENWMRKAEFDNELAKMALSSLQQAIKKCIHWFNTHKSDVVIKIYNLSVVKHILTQFEYIAQNELTGVNKTPEELIYLAIERSVASIIKPNAIDKFHEEMSDVLGPPLPRPVLPAGWVTEALYLSPRLAAVEPTVRACFASDDSHLLMIGPDACAKNLLAEYVAKESNGTVITIACTPILEPTDIIAELRRNNVVGSGGRGGGSRFTLVVRSLHRASVDAWGSSAVCSFLLQVCAMSCQVYQSSCPTQRGGVRRARRWVSLHACSPLPAPRLRRRVGQQRRVLLPAAGVCHVMSGVPVLVSDATWWGPAGAAVGLASRLCTSPRVRRNVVGSGGRGGGSRFTLVVRSLHRASVDAWGSSAVCSFLLQSAPCTAPPSTRGAAAPCAPSCCRCVLCHVRCTSPRVRRNVVGSGGRGGGSRFTVVVRSLHRASVDAWGSSAVCSFLLQLINWSGFWMRGSEEEGMQWAGAARVRVLATAAAPPAPRLHARLATVLLPEPDDDEMLELARVYLRQSTDKNISDTDISGLASNVLSMFKEVTETFRTKLHYYWNASHFKQWCENIQWYSPSNVAELITALVAEANSIFKDRLASEEEKASYNSIFRSFFKGIYNEGLLFVTKLRSDGVYMEAVDNREWYHTTQKYINQCLSEREQSVFGEDGAEVCLELATLCPAFARATNGGVVVCVGSAGTGRRAAALVAAAALPAALFTVTRDLDFNPHFKNALSSSCEGSRTLVLVRESAVNHTTLASIEALHRAQSTHCIPAHIMPTFNNTPQTQVLQNIKQNLGIVICLDKDQDDLFELMEKFPLLYKDSHLIWIERWCGDTLAQMPQLVIQRLIKDSLSDSPKKQHEAIPVEGFVSIYSSLDVEWMKAPCRYIGFIKTYFYIVSRKKEALVQRKTMLSAGVEALKRARSEVATLQAEAAQQEAALSEKQAAANQALDQIGATVRATTDKKEEMHALKQSIEQENSKLQIRKQEIEKELASVEPVIAAARAAVGDIRPESLSEIRSLRAPPDVVRDVLEGVLRLMGIADTSWHSMKNFLSKRGVKEDIRCLDARQISPAAAASVARLLERRGASFEPAAARRASAAAAPLAAWVRANLAYAAALDKVQPLQLQQAQLHRNLQEAEGQLAALSSGLATVDERVSALKEQLGQHTRDAAALELRLATAQATIRAARTLLDQLRHEYAAWETDLEYISKEISEIDLRSLLAAAYIIYLPDVTEPKAMEYISKWSVLLGFEDQSFSPINFLASTEKQLKWDADGLPSDTSAVKNAVIIDQYLESNKCGFMPLIIDPDGEAISWLKSALVDTACDFVAQDSEKLQTALQYAVRLGRTLVITEVTEVRPAWLAGGRLLLLGRDAAAAARLPPHQAARLARLLFAARRPGLTDQLINYALQQQYPEINEKMKEIKLKKAIMQKQQHELQENLLKDLSANGDILHDANLLASLNKTRATSATIAEALEAARAIEDETQAASRAFASSASRAANVALAVKQLAARRPLLALHVDTVLQLYGAALARLPKKSKPKDEEVIKYLMRRIVERVLLSLHKKDKYIVVLYLLRQVYVHLIPEKLWQMFIGSSGFIEDLTVVNEIKKIHPWIQSEYVKKIAQLKITNEELFNKMCLSDEAVWKKFQSSGDVADISKLKLTEFEVVLAVALLRPESLYRAIVTFVDQLLGTGVMSGGDTIPRAARWGGARPVLLLGAHAADVLAAHAPHLTQVGIEEGRVAWEASVAAARNGWLALIVGASPFTAELQAFLDARARAPVEESNPDFRLWIVSEDREIPPVISNTCVNVIIEAPEGVKPNVLSTLSAWAQYSGDVRVVRAHACLALLHAIVQERRAYIPQGWSRWYAWEWGEVRASTLVLRAGGPRALVGALYGARAAAAPDRALLQALLRACLDEPALAHGWRGPAPDHAPLRLPFTTELQAYSSAFNELPDIDSPQLLGLPANCRLAWEKNAAEDIIAGLKELNSTVVTSRQRGDSTALKSLLALWKKLMSGNPLLKGEYQPEQESGGWWGAVVGGEAREAAHAACAIHAALGKLARAGHAPAALLRTPEEWQLLWSGPEAPDAYLKEFCHRALAAARNVAPLDDDYMPKEVDLRCFLRPERVLCAVRARAASRPPHASHKLALQVVWDPADGGDGDAASSLGVVGLRLTGARWDAAARALRPCAPACAPHAPAPRLLLRPGQVCTVGSVAYCHQRGDGAPPQGGRRAASSLGVVGLRLTGARWDAAARALRPCAPACAPHAPAPRLLLRPGQGGRRAASSLGVVGLRLTGARWDAAARALRPCAPACAPHAPAPRLLLRPGQGGRRAASSLGVVGLRLTGARWDAAARALRPCALRPCAPACAPHAPAPRLLLRPGQGGRRAASSLGVVGLRLTGARWDAAARALRPCAPACAPHAPAPRLLLRPGQGGRRAASSLGVVGLRLTGARWDAAARALRPCAPACAPHAPAPRLLLRPGQGGRRAASSLGVVGLRLTGARWDAAARALRPCALRPCAPACAPHAPPTVTRGGTARRLVAGRGGFAADGRALGRGGARAAPVRARLRAARARAAPAAAAGPGVYCGECSLLSPEGGRRAASSLGVVGLRLTGARWDAAARALRPCAPACAPHAPAPRLLLRPGQESALAGETSFEIPVYNNEAREQVLFTARAPLHHTLSRDTALLNAAALFVARAD